MSGAQALEGCPLVPPTDRVICAPCAREVMAGGLHLPEVAQEKSRYAVVVAVGTGERTPSGLLRPRAEYRLGHDPWEACSLAPGDVVVLPDVGGTEIDIEGRTYVSITAAELLAVVVP